MITPRQIYEQTNGGLDIILAYYPQAEPASRNRRVKFAIRDEKTPSATLSQYDGIWWVKDYGSGDASMTAIDVVMREENLEFGKAIRLVAEKFNIEVEGAVLKARPEVRNREVTETDQEGDCKPTTKAFSETELKSIFAPRIWAYLERKAADTEEGKKLTPEERGYNEAAKVCKRFNLVSLESYTRVSRDKETGKLKVTTFGSNDNFPIFMFEEGTWQKYYKPKELKPEFRFFSAGQKPKDYLFGYAQAKAAYEQLNAEMMTERIDTETGEVITESVAKEKKLPEIIICTGGSDALNVAALGYQVVWMNSETADLTETHWRQLNDIAYRVYNLPDIDETGKREALDLAKKYLEIHTVYLPETLKSKHDLRGKTCKDVRDFFTYYGSKEFETLLKKAYPMRFWDGEPKFKRDGKPVVKNGRALWEYSPNNELLYEFLYRNNFGQYEDKSEKQGTRLIHIDGTVVKKIEFRHINSFIKEFIKSDLVLHNLKGGRLELLNAFHRSTNFSSSSMENLNFLTPSFDDYGSNYQYLFFKNAAWCITAESIEAIDPKKCPISVWEEEVIEQEVKPLPPLFSITKDDHGEFDLVINEKDCQFLNFVINSSRVHWRDELETELDKLTPAEREAYLKLHRFEIAGPLLTDEKRKEQKMVLLSKLLSFGYLLHRFKDEGNAFCVWAMDYNMQMDMEEDASAGGTGKSLSYIHLTNMMKSKNLDGRNAKLWENPHVLDGVSEHTDLLFFDDCNKYFQFDNLFSKVTSFTEVNPKGLQAYTIPFKDSPKIVCTSNYPPSKNDKSTRRRLWFTVFSDYYHKNANGEYREHREPKDEFEMSFFTGFDAKQWNLYLNLMAQCVQAWMQYGKVEASEHNVINAMLRSKMGPNFQAWADVYFSVENSRINTDVPRYKAFEEYKRKYQATISSHSFLEKVAAWCKYNGYVLNPVHLRNDKDKKRILRFVEKEELRGGEWQLSGKKESVEMLYIQTDDSPTTTPTPIETKWYEKPAEIDF